MNVQYLERMESTEIKIKEYYEQSLAIMLKKNRDRGDCWRNSGLKGQFIEIHSMYFRLRNLIWEKGMPDPSSEEWESFTKQVANALEDMRNFTMLAEMCLQEKNIDGKDFTNGLHEL